MGPEPIVATQELWTIALIMDYVEDPELKVIIDSIDSAKADFDNAWKSISSGYSHLKEFLGGLATVFPTT